MVGVAPHFEFRSLRMMLFLVPTFFFVFLVEGIVTVVEQRYDLYSWYLLLVDGGSRICNQIYLILRAATWTLLL